MDKFDIIKWIIGSRYPCRPRDAVWTGHDTIAGTGVCDSGGFNNLGTFSTPTGLITSNVGVGDIRENPKFTSVSGVATDFNTTYGWSTDSGWLITVSSQYDSTTFIPHNAFDKTNSQWITGQNIFNATTGYPTTLQWIAMKIPEQVYMRSFSILFRDAATANSPREFSIQGSDDGSNWTTLQSYTNQTGWVVDQIRTFADISPTHPPYFNFRLLLERSNNGTDIRIKTLHPSHKHHHHRGRPQCQRYHYPHRCSHRNRSSSIKRCDPHTG